MASRWDSKVTMDSSTYWQIYGVNKNVNILWCSTKKIFKAHFAWALHDGYTDYYIPPHICPQTEIKNSLFPLFRLWYAHCKVPQNGCRSNYQVNKIQTAHMCHGVSSFITRVFFYYTWFHQRTSCPHFQPEHHSWHWWQTAACQDLFPAPIQRLHPH